MAVKIKLMRLGRIRQPYYRIVVADARTRRNGRAIETIGKYHPKEQPSLIEVDSERVQYWLGVGAQPTDPVQHLLEVTGDWQRFKGLPGAEGTLQRAEPKPDKAELFNRALALAGEVPTTEATTPRRKASRQIDTGTGVAPDKNVEKAPEPDPAEASSAADDREDTATVADGQV
ncbi:MAG: 30S ribosomal protein S16 [Pseudonocardiaceae bacterium]